MLLKRAIDQEILKLPGPIIKPIPELVDSILR